MSVKENLISNLHSARRTFWSKSNAKEMSHWGRIYRAFNRHFSVCDAVPPSSGKLAILPPVLP